MLDIKKIEKQKDTWERLLYVLIGTQHTPK